MTVFHWSNKMTEDNAKKLFQPFFISNIEDIKRFSHELYEAMPILRNILEDQINVLKPCDPFINITSIDGSNSKPIKTLFFTIYSVNSNAVLQYTTMPRPAKFLKVMEYKVDYTHSFSNSLMHLERDVLEMETYLELNRATAPEIVFLDGSINSRALWHARLLQQSIDPYTIVNSFKNLYEKTFKDPNGVWSKVMDQLARVCSIWIPKRTVSKSFIYSLTEKHPELKLPEGITNQIFSLILKPDEYLGPVPFETWVQTSTSVVRKFIKEIYTVYYKPPSSNFKAIKLEFHKNFLPVLDRILNTVRKQFSIHTDEILPISWAHNCATSEKIDIEEINALIQLYAMLKEIDPKIKEIIRFLFRRLNSPSYM